MTKSHRPRRDRRPHERDLEPACADLDADEADDVFFTAAGRTLAKRLCSRCPVAGPCLEAALEAEGDDPAGYRYGIYAGTNGQERARAAGASLSTYGGSR